VLGRVPTEIEALAFISAEGLYTGTWSDNFRDRENRVKQILARIAKTFDPTKCSSNVHQLEAHSLQQKRAFVQHYYPRGIAYHHDPGVTQPSNISCEHAAVFLTITEFCLIHSPNPDASVPRERFESLWKQMRERKLTSACWNRHHWIRLRELFVNEGMIEITDREFAPGKAMRWRITSRFPVSQSCSPANIPITP
jgi:hypothetical protein